MKVLNYLKPIVRTRWLSQKMSSANFGSKYGDDSSGGHIRDAGGAFGKMEAAKEDQYFYNLQKEQLKELKSHMSDEITFHQEQIKRHQEAISKAKEKLDNLTKQ